MKSVTYYNNTIMTLKYNKNIHDLHSGQSQHNMCAGSKQTYNAYGTVNDDRLKCL